MQTREETNTEASLLNTPLAGPLTTLSTSNATPTRISRIRSARHGARRRVAGLYMFVLPYAAKWRGGRRAGELG
jgi:hypothetical protein